MKKLLMVMTMSLASVLVAQDKTISSADARGKIGDIIKDPSSMTSVMKQLAASGYLTGGGLAINRGAREFFSGVLDRPVRDLPRKTGKMSSPIYTSALGVLDVTIDTLINANANRGIKAFFNNLFGG